MADGNTNLKSVSSGKVTDVTQKNGQPQVVRCPVSHTTVRQEGAIVSRGPQVAKNTYCYGEHRESIQGVHLDVVKQRLMWYKWGLGNPEFQLEGDLHGGAFPHP